MAYSKKIYRYKFILFSLGFFLNACSYSFSGGGATLSKEIKMIQIEQFLNNTISPNTSLAPDFTKKLQNIFRDRTSLIAVENDGDLVLEGEFTQCDTEVINISNDRSQGNRLIVKVKVRYRNKKQPTKYFEQEFETFEDFGSDETLSLIEPRLIPLIVERLTNEVFNKVYNDW
ncbi:MAG: LPS assembly lipoprotein LptE [Flavobacteriales bacterium AspAUS03]